MERAEELLAWSAVRIRVRDACEQGDEESANVGGKMGAGLRFLDLALEPSVRDFEAALCVLKFRVPSAQPRGLARAVLADIAACRSFRRRLRGRLSCRFRLRLRRLRGGLR